MVVMPAPFESAVGTQDPARDEPGPEPIRLRQFVRGRLVLAGNDQKVPEGLIAKMEGHTCLLWLERLAQAREADPIVRSTRAPTHAHRNHASPEL